MQYRKLGASDLEVSVVGLGCNNLGRDKTATESQEGTNAVVAAALDAGINFFDVADIYGSKAGVSESMLGVALGAQRENVIVATKFGMDVKGANNEAGEARGSRKYIRKSVEASLQRLGTDYIDLYQFHTPDEHTDIAQTLAALSELVEEGKIRYFGHCNFAGWQIAQAHYVAELKDLAQCVSTQNHYNLLDRRAELEVMPAARELGLGMFPYFPLANGLLTDKYRDPAARKDTANRLVHSKSYVLKNADWQQLEKYYAFCDARSLSITEATFSWLAQQQPVSSIIAGATKPEQVLANAQAASVTFSEAELQELDEIFPTPPKIALF